MVRLLLEINDTRFIHVFFAIFCIMPYRLGQARRCCFAQRKSITFWKPLPSVFIKDVLPTKSLVLIVPCLFDERYFPSTQTRITKAEIKGYPLVFCFAFIVISHTRNIKCF